MLRDRGHVLQLLPHDLLASIIWFHSFLQILNTLTGHVTIHYKCVSKKVKVWRGRYFKWIQDFTA
jgi:hypothetical protein